MVIIATTRQGKISTSIMAKSIDDFFFATDMESSDTISYITDTEAIELYKNLIEKSQRKQQSKEKAIKVLINALESVERNVDVPVVIIDPVITSNDALLRKLLEKVEVFGPRKGLLKEWRSKINIPNNELTSRKRRILQKSLLRAIPMRSSSMDRGIPTVQANGIRFSCKETMLDGFVISTQLAHKLDGFVIRKDYMTVPGSANIILSKSAADNFDKELVYKTAEMIHYMKEVPSELASFCVKKGDVLAIAHTDKGEQILKASTAGVITSYSYTGDDNAKRISYEITSMRKTKIGDKISDLHMNKGTISAVLPREEMPSILLKDGSFAYCDVIMPSFIHKRKAYGAWKESKKVSLAYWKKKPINVSDLYTIDLIRTDNIAEDSSSFNKQSVWMELFITAAQSKIGFETLKGEIAKTETMRQIVRYIYALANRPGSSKIFEITERIPRKYLGKIMTKEELESLDIPGSAIDKRLREGWWGIIKDNNSIFAVVPPHSYPTTIGTIPTVAIEANKIIADLIWERYGNYCPVNRRGLLSLLLGDTLKRIYETDGVRGVATNSFDSDIYTVYVPQRYKKRFTVTENNEVKGVVKRDPVHHHIVNVTVKFWNNNTIGIHPVLMHSLNGDYDGDTVCVYTNPKLFHGLSLVLEEIPKEIKHNAKSFTEVNEAIENLWTQNHPLDEEVTQMETIVDDNEDMFKATKEIVMIKNATAFVGHAALCLITKLDYDDPKLNKAILTYHTLAQNALDMKHHKSGESITERTIEYIYNNGPMPLEYSKEERNLLLLMKKANRHPHRIYSMINRSRLCYKDAAEFAIDAVDGNLGKTVIEEIIKEGIAYWTCNGEEFELNAIR